MRKKSIAIMLTATMILGMTGCSENKENGDSKGTTANVSEDAGETQENQSSETPTETNEETTGETTETQDVALTVWSPSEDQDPAYGQWLNTMCEQFNALHPEWNITFTYGVCSESDTKTLVPQDIDAAGDVFIYSSTGLENLCESNCLTEFGGKYLDTINENYSSVLVDCMKYEDGVYGVPMTTNTFFMYYDKSVFSEDDVKSLETMLSKGKVAIPITDGFYLSAFYLGAGCEFFGPDGTDREAGISLNTENGVAMTNYLVDLVQNENLVVASTEDAISMMREGNVDAYFCGTWQAAQTQECLGENFGVAVLPTVMLNGTETQLRPFSSAKAIGVKSTTAYPEVAIELAMYLGGYDAQKAHYDLRNYVPCYKSLLEDETIQQDIVVAKDAETIENIAASRANFTEMSYYWAPAQSFGTELRDGVITHENAAEKTASFEENVNSSGVE